MFNKKGPSSLCSSHAVRRSWPPLVPGASCSMTNTEWVQDIPLISKVDQNSHSILNVPRARGVPLLQETHVLPQTTTRSFFQGQQEEAVHARQPHIREDPAQAAKVFPLFHSGSSSWLFIGIMLQNCLKFGSLTTPRNSFATCLMLAAPERRH